jgi:methylthioribose-1-phosphate isomerase
VVEKGPPVVEEKQSVQLTNSQHNKKSEINSEDMEECMELGVNGAAAKYVHDKISQTICSKRIVCGGRYREWCLLYCAIGFCLQNR